MFPHCGLLRIAFCGMAVAMSSVETRAASWRVTVRHSGASLGETPIIAEVPTAVPIGKYVLEAPSGGKNLPANVFSDAGKTYLGTVLPNVPGDKTLSFSLSPATNTDPAIPGVLGGRRRAAPVAGQPAAVPGTGQSLTIGEESA